MATDPLEGWPGILRDEPLGRHSQLGIGGPADWYVRLEDAGDLRMLLPLCAAAAIPVTVIGAGSNALIQDGGIRGLVVQLADRHLEVHDDAGVVALGGGCMMPRAALDLAKRGLAGLEFGIGIPGTCGASVRGNAGAFGREIGDVLVDCDVISPAGEERTVANAGCDFAYRRSVLSDGGLTGWIVLAARFRVEPDDAVQVRRRTDHVTEQRKATQPWGLRSLGSVFKNPPGDHAGRLVEAAGLKGTRCGGAEISNRHANFIVNANRATAADVLTLARLAEDTVRGRFGVALEREIVVLGEPR